MKNRVFIWIIASIMLTCSVIAVAPVLAADINGSHSGTINVEMRDSASGRLYAEEATLRIYQVAQMKMVASVPQYTATVPFIDLNPDFSDLSSARQVALAQEFYNRITSRNLQALEQQSGNTGIFKFDGLDLGIYLISYESANNSITVTPFLVILPIKADDGDWYYILTVYPKFEATPSPTLTPIPTPTPSDSSWYTPTPTMPQPSLPIFTINPDEEIPLGNLPQTGPVRWPIIVLGMLGLLLFSLGWLDLFRKKG